MIDTEALRKKVIDLAIQGKLTEQLPSDGDAETLYAKILDQKSKLIKEGKIKKDKALPDIAADEIPFEVPDNWKWVRLTDISTIINGDRGKNYPAKSTLSLEGIPFISALNLNGVGVDNDDRLMCLSKEQYDRLGSGKLQKDDIVICIRGSLGKHGRYPFNEGAIASSLVICRPHCYENEIGGFIMKWLDSSMFPREINKYDGGSAQPNLAAENLKKFLVPLPPIEEQTRIVDTLDEVLAQIDIIDDLQAKYSNDLAVLKSKIIDAGIRGKLTEQLSEDGDAESLYSQIQEEKAKLIKEGRIKKEKPLPEIDANEIPFEIPKNWKWVRLGDICSKISSGSTPTGGSKGGAYVSEGYCFFREQNIYNDGIHEEGMVYISDELLNSRPNSTVYPRDILLNITGGSIGRCALVPDDFSKGSINQHILIIRTIEANSRFFVHHYMCSPYYQKIIMGNVVGDKDGFSAGRCKNTLIPLPPMREQARIIERIDALLNVTRELGE